MATQFRSSPMTRAVGGEIVVRRVPTFDSSSSPNLLTRRLVGVIFRLESHLKQAECYTHANRILQSNGAVKSKRPPAPRSPVRVRTPRRICKNYRAITGRLGLPADPGNAAKQRKRNEKSQRPDHRSRFPGSIRSGSEEKPESCGRYSAASLRKLFETTRHLSGSNVIAQECAAAIEFEVEVTTSPGLGWAKNSTQCLSRHHPGIRSPTRTYRSWTSE